MIDVDSFNDEQKRFLRLIVSDFGGPTATPALLNLLERVLYQIKPDWELDTFQDSPDARQDIEVCMAALTYLRISELTDSA